MSVQHVNRRGQTYYLHQGQTKTGKPKYYFSMNAEGNLVDTVPQGYEIYENPNAQVFLRRVRPKIIGDDEVAVVEQGVASYARVPYYIIDVKDKAIVVYLADQDMDLMLNAFDTDFLPRPDPAALSRFLSFSPMMRFVLADEETRTFFTQRYCFLGSIDDWIDIGRSGPLEKLIRQFVPHLGQQSFYDLYY